MKSSLYYKRGFSLLELSIVIAILSLMIAGGLSLAADLALRANADDTREKLKVIDEAIQNYLRKNDYLPCPASPDIYLGDNTDGDKFGLAPDEYSPSLDCTSASGIANTDILQGTTVRLGIVPVRSLKLADSFARDAYGHHFYYAVSKNLTQTSGNYSGNSGAIEVQDGADNIIVADAAYIIFSTGPNRMGSRNADTSNPTACTAGTADTENCQRGPGSDNVFRDARYNDGDTAAYFDDFVIWQHKQNLHID